MAWASPEKVTLGIIAFVLWWVLAVFPKVPILPIGRTAGSILGAVLMVVFQVVKPREAFAAVDLSVLSLLFGTMVLTGYLERADLFKYLGYALSWKSQGGTDLLCRVSLLAALSSAIFTNDTTCVVLTTFVLRLCREKNLPPDPFLIALACSANIGSAGTLIGNPQNLVIAQESQMGFRLFSMGVMPAVAVGLVTNTLGLYLVYRRRLSRPLTKALEETTALIVAIDIKDLPSFKQGRASPGTIIAATVVDDNELGNDSSVNIGTHIIPQAPDESLSMLWQPATSTDTQSESSESQEQRISNGRVGLVGRRLDVMQVDWRTLSGSRPSKAEENYHLLNLVESGNIVQTGQNEATGLPLRTLHSQETEDISLKGALQTLGSQETEEISLKGALQTLRSQEMENNPLNGGEEPPDLSPQTNIHIPIEPVANGQILIAFKKENLLWKIGVYMVTLGMLAAFLAGFDLPWSALTGAVLLMVVDSRDAGPSLNKVKYSLLVFFAGMFITIAGFNATGVPGNLWSAVEPYAHINTVGGLLILSLVITVLSNLASNVPTVLLLGPRLAISVAATDGISSVRAWMILAWVSTVAGNLTLMGSAANIIVSEEARHAEDGHELTFWNHLRFGLPSTIIVILVGLPFIYG